MKKLVFGLFILGSQVLYAQTDLWTVNFNGLANGTTNGTTSSGVPGGTWSVTTTPSGTFSKQTIPIIGTQFFRADQTVTEGVWATDNFSISTTGMATVSITLLTGGTNSTDYIRAYYKVDGGSEILFAELLGSILSVTVPGSAIVSGSNLQIVVRSNENTAGSFLGVPFSIGFDDLTIVSAPAVYSRASTAWNVGTTWSTVSFVGASCACTPTTGQVAVIGGGFTVDLTADALVGGVDIQNTGTLRYTAANLDLGIEAGLLRVRNGGTLNRNGQAAAQIDYNQDVGGATLQVDVGGTVTIEDVTLTANATNLHYFTGGGSLTIADDILIGADGATLTNNMSAALAVTDRIEFSTGTNNSTFVNNGTLTAATLFFDDDTNFFTNASTATFSANIAANGNGDDNNTITNNSASTLAFVNLDGDAAAATGDGGDMTILNSGTINQTGTFLDIPNNTNALNDINNLAGSTWNYSGTGHDTNVRFFANNPTNTFNYGLSGAQQIITPVAGNGYNNLILQSVAAAAKTALANFSVSGNYTRSGAATLAPGAFTITLNGTTAAQTISAVGVETFAGLTLNNTFGTSPQITASNAITVTAILTMTSGNINLNGNDFTISSTASGALARTSGWMYGGTITRNRPASTIILVTTLHSAFPLGSSGDFRPFLVGQNSNANTLGTMTVSHTNGTATSTVSFPEGIVRRNDAFWTITTSVISTGPTFSLQAGGTNFGTIEAGAAGLADLRMSTSTGVVGTHGAATGGPDYRVNRTALTFNDLANNFHVASTDAVNSPLPIVLLGFAAELKGSIIDLTWSTASELNNDFFTIERATDIEKFEEVAIVKGQGTINSKTNYTSVDESPLPGRSYYRLKQTDFDGKFTYSELRKIENSDFKTHFKIYPNPVVDRKFNFELTGIEAGIDVPLRVVNMQGISVFDAGYKSDQSGRIKSSVELTSVASGVYIVIINTVTGLRKKIVIP
ncbi:MAG: T9SS type A sorting domain-containing protein [Bacteroidota bacterium]